MPSTDFCFGGAVGPGTGHCHCPELNLRGLDTPRGDDQQEVGSKSGPREDLETQRWDSHPAYGFGTKGLRSRDSLAKI